jgi:hypothetical protein
MYIYATHLQRGREGTWQLWRLPGPGAWQKWARSAGFPVTQPLREPASAQPGAGATDPPALMQIGSKCVIENIKGGKTKYDMQIYLLVSNKCIFGAEGGP